MVAEWYFGRILRNKRLFPKLLAGLCGGKVFPHASIEFVQEICPLAGSLGNSLDQVTKEEGRGQASMGLYPFLVGV